MGGQGCTPAPPSCIGDEMRTALSMQAILECGHGTVWIYRQGVRLPPAEFNCGECGEFRKPVAMESREWRAVCRTMGCRWSRWAGQSEDIARQNRRHHQNSHPRHVASIGYVAVKEKAEMIREAYGRRFPIGMVKNTVRRGNNR